jgi:hypothetical protein
LACFRSTGDSRRCEISLIQKANLLKLGEPQGGGPLKYDSS